MKILKGNRVLFFLLVLFFFSSNVFAQTQSWDSYYSDDNNFSSSDSSSSTSSSTTSSTPASTYVNTYTYSDSKASTTPASTITPTSTKTQTSSYTTPSTQTTSSYGTSTTSTQAPAPTISYEIQGLITKGQLVEAQTKLQALLKDTYTTSKRNEIEEKISELNMQLLFSDKKFDGVLIYTVKSGDNLYNIAKKHKTSVNLIQKMNDMEKAMIYPDQKLRVINGAIKIDVDKSENKMRIYLGETFFKVYPVATGASGSITPEGTFTVVNKLENPTWYKTGAVIEPGSPDNLLGTRWLGFSKKGYGIHGTVDPESIGKHVTSGCVRMVNQDVEELFDIVPRGTQVRVIA